MFRNVRSSARDPLLPTSNNGRRGDGGSMYGAARSSRPDISKSFIATVVWALVSVGLVAWGWLYCARRVESSTFSCNHFMCTFEQNKGGATELLKIPRSRLVGGEMVRVKNGEIVQDYGRLKRSEQRKLGHSYAIIYIEPDSEDDDDESYDSFEEDDDSYDSYDDDQASSEDDEGDERTIIPPKQKTPPSKPEAIARREEERKKYTRERDEDRMKMGVPPTWKPDVPPRRVSEGYDDGGGRFPGDAATMEQRKKDTARFEESGEMSARAQAEAHRQKFNMANSGVPSQDAMMRQAKADMEARGWKNSPQDRMAKSISPDDPDNITPQEKVEDARPEVEKRDVPADAGAGQDEAPNQQQEADSAPGQDQASSQHLQDIEAEIARLEAEANEMKIKRGGGRDISSIGGHEEIDELLQDDGIPISARANGSRRKLLTRRRPTAHRRSRQEKMEDVERDRDAHRKGHGHHQKRKPKVAHPRTVEEEEAEELGEAIPEPKTKHHHRAFHHKENVPKEARHHVHHGYHHRPGDKKVDGGWMHQNRQWHKHERLKKLGTSYSLGRSKARKRKEAIDKYAKKDVHKLELTDSRRWRTGGVWMMFIGCMSATFCLVIGNFQPRPKTKKVS